MQTPRAQRLLRITLPIALVAAFCVATTVLVQGIERRFAYLSRTHATNLAADLVESRAAYGLFALTSIDAFFLGSEEVTSDEFAMYARNIFPSLHGFVSLQWVDPDHVVRYVYPLEGENLKAVDLDNKQFPNRLKPILQAMESRTTVATMPIFLVQGYPGVIMYHPIFRGDEYLGAAVGVIRLSAIMEDAAAQFSDLQAAVTVDDRVISLAGGLYTANGNRIVSPAGDSFPDPASPKVPPAANAVSVPFSVADKEWRLHAALPEPFSGPFTVAYGLLGLTFTLLTAAYVLSLDKKNAKLRSTLERERNFISLVSHQLREPLTELSWMTEVAADKHADPAEREEALLGMQQIVRQSVKLTNDLLNVSRVERGLLSLDLEDVPVTSLIDDALVALQEAAKKKNVRFEIDVPAATAVRADRVKATEALRNIVDNALKYGPAGSQVEISAKAAEDRSTVSIMVRDHGPGIPEDVRPRLFEMASAFAKKGESGAGLGMYLAKLFVTAMDGTIDFETSPKGTTFVVTLPAARTNA